MNETVAVKRKTISYIVFNIITVVCFALSCGFCIYFGAVEREYDLSALSGIMAGVFLVLLVSVGFLYRKLLKVMKQNDLLVKEKEELEEESQQYQQLKEMAEHENLMKTAFMNSVASQFKSPLSTISGMEEMLKEKESDEEKLGYLDNIYCAGKIMDSLLSDLADLSKIENGNLYIEQAAYSLAEVIRETYMLSKASAQAKSIELELQIDEQMPTILRGDEKRMKQVILNLLSNAITYTPIGKVSYRIHAVREENRVCLNVEVKDTGIGIKKEDMSQGFGTFQAKIDPMQRLHEGMGLGLTVTNQILQQMNSFLEVESEYGQGSTFKFSVYQDIVEDTPIGTKEEVLKVVHAPKREALKAFVAPNAKILAVDDNRMNLAVMNGLLKKTKMQVHCVCSGEECLEAIKKESYHLIFLDYLMPGMDGVQTLKRMYDMKDNLSADAPVIVVAASASSDMKKFYLREGFTDYISKPIEMASLYQLVKKYLPEELVMNPDSALQQIASDVITIQESIENKYTKEDVIEALEKVKKAMIDFDIQKATTLLNKLGTGEIPQEYRHDVDSTIQCMGNEDFEKVAFYLDRMLKDME